MIYSIISRAVWEQVSKQSVYAPDSLETDGFIHCSTKEQIPWERLNFIKGVRICY